MHFDADSDPPFYFYADLDPPFDFDADPDPALHSDAGPDPAFPIWCESMRILIRNTALYVKLKSLINAVFIEQVSFFVENFSSSENEELEDPLDTAVGIFARN